MSGFNRGEILPGMRDVVITRVEDSGSRRRSRNLEERLMVRFPGAYRALAALAMRLSPRSRLRRALLCRAIVSGWDAGSRRDFELMLVRYARDVEVEFDPEFEALGMGGTFRGHDGFLKMIQAFGGDAWEGWELLPATVLDLGDRVLVLGVFRMPGTASGLEFEREWAQLITARGGLVVREQSFFGWDKGLRTAGLDPDAIALPSRAKAGQAASSAG
jgi:ketosteroid isomerase-like protein